MSMLLLELHTIAEHLDGLNRFDRILQRLVAAATRIRSQLSKPHECKENKEQRKVYHEEGFFCFCGICVWSRSNGQSDGT